jgi:hypothetical protein
MATGRIENICASMKRFIDLAKKAIKRKEETIRRLEERLQKLTSQPNPDAALVKHSETKLNSLNPS